MLMYSVLIITFGYVIFYAFAVQEYNNINIRHSSKMILSISIASVCFVVGGMLIGMDSKEDDMRRDFRMACNETRSGVFICDFNTAIRQY